jgi:hypothetical protein
MPAVAPPAPPRAAPRPRPSRRAPAIRVHARGYDHDDERNVTFDGEDDWEDEVRAPNILAAAAAPATAVRAATPQPPPPRCCGVTRRRAAPLPPASHPAPLPFCPAPQETGLQGSAGPFLRQALRGLGMVSDALTRAAMRVVPEDTPPAAVRTAVTGGMVLVAGSFVKGILSVSAFFLLFLQAAVLGLGVRRCPHPARRRHLPAAFLASCLRESDA